MSNLPKCPACGENYTYLDGHIYVCPICFHEWSDGTEEVNKEKEVRDAVGNVTADGDRVTIIKDLKLGGSIIKQGSKVTGLKILDTEVNGHDLEGRVEGFGILYLKSSVIKKTK